MHTLLIATLLLPLAQQPDTMPAGDASAGAAVYARKLCRMCHGEEGEGGYGPDIAGGRGLTFAQFQRAIWKPGIGTGLVYNGNMPFYSKRQVSEQQMANLFAFVKSLEPVSEPGSWHWMPAPASASPGQRHYIQGYGCGQCHEPENKFGRMWLGEHAKEVDYEYFAKQIYEHEEKRPGGGMPLYTRETFPEDHMRQMYQWMVLEIGMRASIGGVLTVAEQQEDQTDFNLTLSNRGVKDVGLDVERLTVFVKLPPGTTVINGSEGYKVMPLAELGLLPALPLAPHAHDTTGHVERPDQDLSGDVVVWKVPKLTTSEKVALSFSLSGAKPSDEFFQAFAGSTVHWESPGRRVKGSPPIMVYRDLRIPDNGDHERIFVVRPQQ